LRSLQSRQHQTGRLGKMKLSTIKNGKLIKDKKNNAMPPFQGLSEKDIAALYNLVPNKELNPGDFLIHEGDVNPAAYIILSGKISVQKKINGRTAVLSHLGKGDWIGESDFTRKIPSSVTILAVELTVVMAIEPKVLNTLEANIQLHFLKIFQGFAFKRIEQLEDEGIKLRRKNAQITADIYHARTQHMVDPEKSELVQEICKKIPKLPAYTNSLINDIMSDHTSAAQIAEGTMKDPALVGLVLKRINSSYYGFQNKVSDIQHAITLLGFNKLYQLITAEGVSRIMPNTPEYKTLYIHCVAISEISYTLSQIKHIGKPVQMATIGLMHVLGQMVIFLLKERNPKLISLIDALDRAQAGGLLLKSWALPDIVWKSVKYQRYPEFAPPHNILPEIRDNIAILYVAHLCYEHYLGKDEEQLPTTFLPEYKQMLNLGQYDLAGIAHQVVLPALEKKIKSLPIPLKKLVRKQK